MAGQCERQWHCPHLPTSGEARPNPPPLRLGLQHRRTPLGPLAIGSGGGKRQQPLHIGQPGRGQRRKRVLRRRVQFRFKGLHLQPRKERQCLSHDGSGNARKGSVSATMAVETQERQCLSHDDRGKRKERQCLSHDDNVETHGKGRACTMAWSRASLFFLADAASSRSATRAALANGASCACGAAGAAVAAASAPACSWPGGDGGGWSCMCSWRRRSRPVGGGIAGWSEGGRSSACGNPRALDTINRVASEYVTCT